MEEQVDLQEQKSMFLLLNFYGKYQAMYGSRNIDVNVYFPDNGNGAGFLDVLDVGASKIYDFKFGVPYMSNAQFNK